MARMSLAGAAVAAAMLMLPQAAQAAPPTFGVMIQQSLSGILGSAAGFEVTASDPDGDPISLTWVFDDGATAVGGTATHVWTTEGVHTATVTVTDSNGEFAQHSFTFTVLPNPFGGGPVTQLPPAPSTPEVGLVDRVLKLSRSGSVPVRLSCAPFVDCHGTVALTARGRKRARCRSRFRAGRPGRSRSSSPTPPASGSSAAASASR